MSGTPPKSTGAALVLGGGVAGIQCSLDLAEGGYKVYLVERAPALGGHMAQLDKTFPTNDCSMCTLAPKLVEAGRHLDIDMITNSELIGLQGEPGHFEANVLHHARYVDPDLCTSCGECVPVCPVTVRDRYNEGLSERKAIYKLYPQAIPNAYAVDKLGYAPCKSACAVQTSAQGYVALIREGKFAEAYRVAAEPNPFPSVCGRICAHACETDCTRGKVDEPIAIASLKRFVCDVAGPTELPEALPVQHAEKIAIVGGGPTGISAARDLAQYGYATTVFEAPAGRRRHAARRHPAITACRTTCCSARSTRSAPSGRRAAPQPALWRRLHRRLAAGRRLQGRLPRRRTAEGPAVSGARRRSRGALQAVDFLREVNLGRPPAVGERVVVIGGGDVAFDTARSALRIQAPSAGYPDVTIAYRRTAAQMPASPEEVEEGLEEQLKIEYLVAPVEILGTNGRVAGIKLQRMELGEPDESGRRRPVPIEGAFIEIPCDTVIMAIGQALVDDFAKDLEGVVLERDQIEVDPATLATGRKGVFAGGDVAAIGPLTAIEAIAAGRRAAAAMHNHLRGEKPRQPLGGLPARRRARPGDRRQDRRPGPRADARARRRHTAHQLRRGPHGLHRGAGRAGGLALPRLRHLQRVHGVRPRLRSRRPAATTSATEEIERRGGRGRAGHGLRPPRLPARRASTATGATPT